MNAYTRRFGKWGTYVLRTSPPLPSTPRGETAAVLNLASKRRRESLRPVRAIFVGDRSTDAYNLRKRARDLIAGARLNLRDAPPLP